jgi:hypothetical protein
MFCARERKTEKEASEANRKREKDRRDPLILTRLCALARLTLTLAPGPSHLPVSPCPCPCTLQPHLSPLPLPLPPSTEPIVFTGGVSCNVPSISGISARRPATPIGLGLEDVPPPEPTIDTKSFQEDERVKVLRKHLVQRGERHNGSSGLPSHQASSSNLAHELQHVPEAFPVPYHTSGADIMYVISVRVLKFSF